MDFFESYNNRQRSMNLSAILDFTPLSRPQKEHLTKVYSVLLLGTCISAAGVLFQNHVTRIHIFLSFMAQIGCFIALSLGARDARNTGKALSGNRLWYFSGFAFFMGTSIGDLIAMAVSLDPALPIQAFCGSAAIFACFSAAALMAKQRSYIFLGSILVSAMSYFAMASLVNMFFGSIFVHHVLLYGTLLAYMGFVIYDTQVTLEDFNRGNRDYLMHAANLYVDLIGIFIRILIILMEKSDKEKKRKR